MVNGGTKSRTRLIARSRWCERARPAPPPTPVGSYIQRYNGPWWRFQEGRAARPWAAGECLLGGLATQQRAAGRRWFFFFSYGRGLFSWGEHGYVRLKAGAGPYARGAELGRAPPLGEIHPIGLQKGPLVSIGGGSVYFGANHLYVAPAGGAARATGRVSFWAFFFFFTSCLHRLVLFFSWCTIDEGPAPAPVISRDAAGYPRSRGRVRSDRHRRPPFRGYCRHSDHINLIH